MTESTSSPRHAVGHPPDRQRASNGAGSAALVLGAIALAGAFFRLVNLGSVLLGTVGVVLGVTGWRLAEQGRATNRGQAVTGVALSAVAIVASIAVMVAGSLGGQGSGSGPGRGARSTLPATTAPADSGPSDPAGVPLPPLDEDPVTENQPGFVAQSYAGRDDQVVRLRSPLADVAIAVIAYRGRGSFTVDTRSGTGDEAESLVSTVGSWQGTTLVNVRNFTNQPVASLRVHADQGQWTVALRPLAAARRWDGTGPVTGRGADVLLARAAFTREASISAVHRGAGEFTVAGYGGAGALAGSLLNGVGDLTGTATVPAGTVVLAVEADGTWTISRR